MIERLSDKKMAKNLWVVRLTLWGSIIKTVTCFSHKCSNFRVFTRKLTISIYLRFNQKCSYLACSKTSGWQCWSHPQFQLTYHDTPLWPHHCLFTFTNPQSTATFSKKARCPLETKINHFISISSYWNISPVKVLLTQRK